MDWTGEQRAALDKVGRWLNAGEPQVFRLFGYAGVGKTTLARHVAGGAKEAAYAAFTGKAALVMRSKGCTGATTIHALIYRAVEDDEGGSPTTAPIARSKWPLATSSNHTDSTTVRRLLWMPSASCRRSTIFC